MAARTIYILSSNANDRIWRNLRAFSDKDDALKEAEKYGTDEEHKPMGRVQPIDFVDKEKL